MRPETKIWAGAGAIGVPAGVIVAWLLGQFGIDMPPEVAAAVGSVVSMVSGYLVPNAA